MSLTKTGFCAIIKSVVFVLSQIGCRGASFVFSAGPLPKVNGACGHKGCPTPLALGRVATFRLRAFFRSKTWFRFVGRFAWQHAGEASRWAAVF